MPLQLLRVFLVFVFFSFTHCAHQPSMRVVEGPEAPATEPEVVASPVCDESNLESCVKEGNLALRDRDFLAAEKFHKFACHRGELKGCYGLGEVAWRVRIPGYVKRARVYFMQACQSGYQRACVRVASNPHFSMAPYNRKKMLLKACESGEGLGCVAAGQREQKYGNPALAPRYFSMACAAGIESYCKKQPPPRKRRREDDYSRQKQLRRISVFPGGVWFYQLMGGPCKGKGCSFHLRLLENDREMDRYRLPWKSTTGPLSRFGTKALSAGRNEGYVGTMISRRRLGPDMYGVLVRQEKGMDTVQHFQAMYIAVDGKIHPLRRKEGFGLYAAILGEYASIQSAKAERSLKSEGECARDFLLVRSDFFPLLKESKIIWAFITTTDERARTVLDYVERCNPGLKGEVKQIL